MPLGAMEALIKRSRNRTIIVVDPLPHTAVFGYRRVVLQTRWHHFCVLPRISIPVSGC